MEVSETFCREKDGLVESVPFRVILLIVIPGGFLLQMGPGGVLSSTHIASRSGTGFQSINDRS